MNLFRYVMFGAFLLLGTVGPALLLRRAFPRSWDAWMGRAVAAAVVIAGVSWAVWRGSAHLGLSEVAVVGATATAVLVVGGWLILLSGVLWAPAAALVQRWEARTAAPTDPSRRSFLRGAVAAVPASAAVMSPVGTAAAMADPVLTEVDIPVEGLHPDLDGLKILQLSDIHLGTWIDPDQVQAIVEKARPHAPDLVCLTGDLADDYQKLPAALDAVVGLGAPLGVVAAIGNHEIYRGRAEFEALLREKAIPLLCSDGVVLSRGGASLWVCGADDPARLGPDASAFLGRTVAAAVAERPADAAATILLSHRPEGFDPAAEHGVTLTLSGHTHGGQIAVGGRSVFEDMTANRYLLGHYQRGTSHLYTTAGLGHWLPFRVGCPCEGALLTLRRV